MKKPGLAAFTLLAALSLGPALARAAESCEPEPGEYYKIDVEAEIPKASIDHSRDREALGILSGRLDRSILGLHQHNTHLTIHHEFAYRPKGAGVCLWLRRVVLTLYYDTPVVYIAKEYPEGGCNYRAILEHEAKHVQVAQSHIRLYKDDFQKALSSLTLPRPNRPLFAADLEAAKAETGAKLTALAKPVFERMQAAMIKAQEKVDLPRQYREVMRRCQSW
jgi:hypothetical protein